jgi:hypothetical protein
LIPKVKDALSAISITAFKSFGLSSVSIILSILFSAFVVTSKISFLFAIISVAFFVDLNYPRDGRGVPLSYTKLDSKQMSKHVNWIEKQAGLSGVELSHITREWERIMAQYKLRNWKNE